MKYYTDGQAKEDALVALIIEEDIPGRMFYAMDMSPRHSALVVDRALHHAMRVTACAKKAGACSCMLLPCMQDPS